MFVGATSTEAPPELFPLPFQHGVGVYMAWVAICSAALFHAKRGALVEMEMGNGKSVKTN
jgi:hypothetical protein